MSLTRQFPLKYTSSVLFYSRSLTSVYPPPPKKKNSPPSNLDRLNLKPREDWACIVSTRWLLSVLTGPYLPIWLALLRRSANRKVGRETEPRGLQEAALTFSDSVTGGRHPRLRRSEFPQQVARSNSSASGERRGRLALTTCMCSETATYYQAT